MFMQDTRPFLEYGALLWANILGILAIILVIVLIAIAFSIKSRISKTLQMIEDLTVETQEKTLETLDIVQDTAFQVAENTFSFADMFGGIAGAIGLLSNLKPKPKAKKRGFVDILKKFM